MSATLDRLRAQLRDDGGLLAATVGVPSAPDRAQPDHAAIAVGGDRAAEHRDEVALAVAAVREGHELHYGRPRALLTDDPDLALLAGDRLYALGLAQLAAVGELNAIAQLADVISLAAQAHAADDPQLAEAAWDAGVAAIAWGPDDDLEAAKAAARRGDPSSTDGLRRAAERLAGAAEM